MAKKTTGIARKLQEFGFMWAFGGIDRQWAAGDIEVRRASIEEFDGEGSDVRSYGLSPNGVPDISDCGYLKKTDPSLGELALDAASFHRRRTEYIVQEFQSPFGPTRYAIYRAPSGMSLWDFLQRYKSY